MSNLLARYRRHYQIPDDVPLSYDDLRRHLVVELEITSRLLASTPEERPAVFAEGYDRIYRELWWFNAAEDASGSDVDITNWVAMIGPPKSILEIGSGQGALARSLGRAGYAVTATDISAARGAQRRDADGVSWRTTDGVHLTDWERPGSFDAVITDQVVEHLHPDDVLTHLRTARVLLREGGRYALRTPHGPSGPYDSSLAFGFPVALGTHLREYSFASRVAMLREAGFSRLFAERPTRTGVIASERYLHYLCAVEATLERVPWRLRRVAVKSVFRDRLGFRRNAIVAAER